MTASVAGEPAGRARKRDKPRIFHDILASIIEQERERDGAARITRIQDEVNLPSDRLRIHVREMSDLGLIQYGKTLTSTEKGRRFMAEYQKIVNTLQQFGLL
ncbi:MAG: winged helix-turn-helix domain-containing protein [Candidatus Bathyarchaeia archaeon]